MSNTDPREIYRAEIERRGQKRAMAEARARERANRPRCRMCDEAIRGASYYLYASPVVGNASREEEWEVCHRCYLNVAGM